MFAVATLFYAGIPPLFEKNCSYDDCEMALWEGSQTLLQFDFGECWSKLESCQFLSSNGHSGINVAECWLSQLMSSKWSL